MPGSGKSYVGKRLADGLGYTFLEFDTLLEAETGMPLQQLVDEWGDERFLEKQATDAVRYTRGVHDTVISPGGSIVYTPDAMVHLQNISTIVYLETPLEVVESRIADVPRGIVGQRGRTFVELYDERVTLYQKWAAFTVQGDQHADSVVADIVDGITRR